VRKAEDRWVLVISMTRRAVTGHMEVPSLVHLAFIQRAAFALLEGCLGGYSTNKLCPDRLQGVAKRVEA
jgi:hypothetical protein